MTPWWRWHKFLAFIKFDSEDTREHLVQICQEFHVNARSLSAEFFSSLKRINYVTPTSYLSSLLPSRPI